MSGPWTEQPGAHPFGEVQAPPPQPGPPLALFALAGGLIGVVVLVGAYVLLSAGQAEPTATPIAGSPTTTATASGSPTSSASVGPSGSSSPSGSASPTVATGRTPPPDIAAVIDAVVAQMPATRELEALAAVPYVLLTRDEARIELEQLLAKEADLRQLETEERVLMRLGLIPAEADLYDLLVELQGAAVAAYYRTDTGTMYIIERDEPFSALDRVFVAHEYTHALQDQHYDLEGTRLTDPAEGDAALAQLAAIEGDASLAMLFWAFGNLSPEEQLEMLGDMTPTDEDLLAGMPPILRRQLVFPYNEGVAFSSEVFARGGWEAINQTITDPPASTEQILHFDKYEAGETPVAVGVGQPLESVGPGWQDVYQQTLGELNAQIWLADGAEPPLPGLPAPLEPWQEAAAGWGGDRLHMYEHSDGRWAIVWVSAWDSAADADEFAALAGELVTGLDYPAGFDFPKDFLVNLVIASDEATVLEFRRALGE